MTKEVNHPSEKQHKPQTQVSLSRPSEQSSRKGYRKMSSSSDLDEREGRIHRGLRNRAEEEVRENEEASLQDDSYTFDSDNTDSEEGLNDFDQEDVGLKDSDDYI
jgi:hypothetical protein